MKTVKQMFDEIQASEELKKEIMALEDMEAIEAFLKKHGCDEPVEKFLTCAKLNSISKEEGELSDDDVASIAGGKRWTGLEWSGGWFFGHTTPFGFWTSSQYLEVDSMCSNIQSCLDAGNMPKAKQLYDKCLAYMGTNGRVDTVYLQQVKGCWPELADYTGPVAGPEYSPLITF